MLLTGSSVGRSIISAFIVIFLPLWQLAFRRSFHPLRKDPIRGSRDTSGSERGSSLTARDGAEDRDQAEHEQNPMRPMQPHEGHVWRRRRPFVEVSMEDEGLDH